MGSGSDVAKDAGDILILDDNLASIVRAVLYGRNIFKSIRKFITLQLTMNFCAVGISMIGPFIGVNAPVTVVQMLWINLIMDTLGGLAFAGEPPLPSCLQEAPKRRDTPILCRYMVHEIVLLGGGTVALFIAFFKLPAINAQFREAPGDLCRLTAFFALFIFASVFHCFNARTDRLNPLCGLSKNRSFLLIMVAILVVQLLFVYLGGSVLRTMPLLPRELALTGLLALCVLPAEGLRKLLWKWRFRGDCY
jgi:magnesium-transporting ATPase (P-type)